MRSFILACALLGMAMPALAQSPTVPVPVDLVNRLYGFLSNGGTYLEAAALREALMFNAQAPQREADVQRRVDTAVSEALAKAKAQTAVPPAAPEGN